MQRGGECQSIAGMGGQQLKMQGRGRPLTTGDEVEKQGAAQKDDSRPVQERLIVGALPRIGLGHHLRCTGDSRPRRNRGRAGYFCRWEEGGRDRAIGKAGVKKAVCGLPVAR